MVEIIDPGLFTTIQDDGREGYRLLGVPVSGAMDQQSFRFANFLLENELETPVLEFTQVGPTLYFHARANVVLTGGKYKALLNGSEVPFSIPFTVEPGSKLVIGTNLSGNYGYLSIEGGFHTMEVLGSASYCPNVNEGALCKKGNNLVFVKSSRRHLIKNAKVTNEVHQELTSIQGSIGPEFNDLTEDQRQTLMQTQFSVGRNSNRMALEIEHSAKLSAQEILTAPVQPGTVQLTPGGNLIALMRDAQTTGGYARVLQLSSDAVNEMAQLKIGQKFQFDINQIGSK